MALLDALKPGTYTTVSLNRYSKQPGSREVRFNINIYQDSSKSKLLTSFEKVLFDPKEPLIMQDKGVNSAPSSPSYGDEIVIGENPTGDLSSMTPGSIATWIQDDDVDVWMVTQDAPEEETIYVESENKHYKIENGEWKEIKGYFSTVQWDQFFDPAIWQQENKNLLTSIYEYLKTTPEFINTTDA